MSLGSSPMEVRQRTDSLENRLGEVWPQASNPRSFIMEIKGRVSSQYASFLHEESVKLKLAVMESNSSEMFRIVRTMIKPIAVRPVGMKRSDGNITSSYTEIRKLFFEHFSKLLDASATSMQELVVHARQWEREHAERRFATEIDLRCIPCLSDTAHILRAHKVGKGLGEDCIGSEIGHFFPGDVACLIYPLLLKSALLISAPIQWKGGQIQEIFKHQGPQTEVSFYCDVALSDLFGKVFYRFFRIVSRDFLNTVALDTQFGSGINSGGTDFASMTIRCAIDYARSKGLGVAIIFVDVVSAFASMCRGLVFDSPD